MYINALAHCPVIAHSDVFKDFLEYDQVSCDLLVEFEYAYEQ